MTKVVVTGGAGFIGSHLSESLCKSGKDVVILDDLSTGRLENIASFADSPNVTFINGSIMDRETLEKAFGGARYVFHLAALPSVPRSIADPLASHAVNATGTLNVLMAARDAGVAKVVFASSSSVYGDTPTLPKREDMTPGPLSPYAVAKLAAEQYCGVFTGVYGLKTICLRYFNVYGPRQDPNSAYAAVIPSFITKLLAGEAPVIYGDGEHTRDFTFVRDVVRANIAAAESDVTGVFNASAGAAVSLNQLIELAMKLTNKTTKPVYTDPRPGDIRHSLADGTKALAFGFRPEYSIEQGLAETVAWYTGGKRAA